MPAAIDPSPKSQSPKNYLLLESLLTEQHEMSAVDTFSHWHHQAEFQTSTYRALMPATKPQPGQQYAFHVDLDACSGCKACVTACHSLNGLKEDESWRRVASLTSDSLPVVQHVTSACHHCVEPGCLLGCPVKAYEKDPKTGIVKHLDDQCFGCKYCTMMCPYEVPQYRPEMGIVRKCDMCTQRLAHDQAPACVQACPNQAIRIDIVNIDPQSITTISSGTLTPTAPSNRITLPTTVYSSKKEGLSLSANDPRWKQVMVKDQLQEAHWPLVAMLTLSQIGVGVWVWDSILSIINIAHDSAQRWLALAIGTTIAIVGLNAAMLHLGRPWLAFRAILGWRTSWLSREALLFGAFAGLSIVSLASLFAIPRFELESSLWTRIADYLPVLTSIVGVISVVSSAMIYAATQRTLWKPSRSIGEMLATAVGLGGLLLGSLVRLDSIWLVVSSLLVLAAFLPKILDVWASGTNLPHSELSLAARSGKLVWSKLRPWFASSVATCVGSIVAAALGLGWISFGLGTIALVFNRAMYFSSVVFPRMPGAAMLGEEHS
jgi:formate dehydrogenase iron-sulfur subunit